MKYAIIVDNKADSKTAYDFREVSEENILNVMDIAEGFLFEECPYKKHNVYLVTIAECIEDVAHENNSTKRRYRELLVNRGSGWYKKDNAHSEFTSEWLAEDICGETIFSVGTIDCTM